MAGASSALAVGAVTTLAAYADAKLHITEDLRQVYSEWQDQRFSRAARKKCFPEGLGPLAHNTEPERAGRMSPWYYFEDRVRSLPANTVCLWTQDGEFTWQETYRRSCQYAQMLLSHGLRPGELVSLCLHNRAEFIFCALATWAVGSAPAMINYNLTGEALVHCLRISGTRFVLVDWDDQIQANVEEVRHRVETELGMKIIILSDDYRNTFENSEAPKPDDTLRAASDLDFPVFLQYTSGSTGYPKSIPFPNRRGSGQLRGYFHRLGMVPGPSGDRWYVPMPLYHGTGFVIAFACLVGGYTLCLSRKFSTSRFWDEIRMSKATAFVYVGEAARYLLAKPPSRMDKDHGIRIMWGNGMRPDVWARFVERFGIDTVAEFFNSSEGMLGLLNVCRGPFTQFAVGHHGALRRSWTRNLYVPTVIDVDSGEIWRDPQTGFAKPASWNVGGEILVRCWDESDFVGYLSNPEASKKKFVRDVFRKGDLYFRTGDALRRDHDGRWYFLDRLGDTFRWKSENVATAEVSQVLGTFPGVVEASVYGVIVPGHDGRAGCAAIYLDQSLTAGEFDFAALLSHSAAKLPRYAVPVFLRILAEPSLTGNAKQNKTPLKSDGIDMEKINQIDQTRGLTPEKMMWLPTALGYSGVDSYIPYTLENWQNLKREASSVL